MACIAIMNCLSRSWLKISSILVSLILKPQYTTEKSRASTEKRIKRWNFFLHFVFSSFRLGFFPFVFFRSRGKTSWEYSAISIRWRPKHSGFIDSTCALDGEYVNKRCLDTCNNGQSIFNIRAFIHARFQFSRARPTKAENARNNVSGFSFGA